MAPIFNYNSLNGEVFVHVGRLGLTARGGSLLRRVMLDDTFYHLFPYNVEELGRIQDDAEDRSAGHDVEEDLLFGGFAIETVHRVWTGALAAAEQHGELEPAVDEVEHQQGAHLENRLKNQTGDVGEEQPSVDGGFVPVEFLLVLGLAVLPVGHVQGHQQGRRGHQDELHGPQTRLRDGEEVVEAGGLAAGLVGVACELLRLVLPHMLGCRHVHQDPEEEDDGEPDAPDHRGVLVHPAEDVLQKAPVHFSGGAEAVRCLKRWILVIRSVKSMNTLTLNNSLTFREQISTSAHNID